MILNNSKSVKDVLVQFVNHVLLDTKVSPTAMICTISSHENTLPFGRAQLVEKV